MDKRKLTVFYGFFGSQLAVLALSLLYYEKISLLSYVNISFYISSALIFTYLLVITVNSGFFDAMSYSFRAVFTASEKNGKKKSIHEMTPLSAMVTFNPHPIAVIGAANFSLMLAGLYFYYL
ncbi:DUF3899 domain-containing protein [Bacillus sp. REN3]|uniref:DUF3899 domain-containing protein n=1 Tax=Bacillus sp. REN3 TaxID=2802440 RepID=UPI001AEE6D3C|nr:DUF3899 domain-containing protein [Bacillus sp. REN3]